MLQKKKTMDNFLSMIYKVQLPAAHEHIILQQYFTSQSAKSFAFVIISPFSYWKNNSLTISQK